MQLFLLLTFCSLIITKPIFTSVLQDLYLIHKILFYRIDKPKNKKPLNQAVS